MLDFSELPTDGIRFEQLIRELLIRSDFEVHWTGVGPDGEKDLIITERAGGILAPFERRWLVSCKHNATSGASVGIDDLPNITDACASVKSDGFLLVCSTQPTSSVVTRLRELEQSGKVLARFWDAIEIEKRLRTPTTLPLAHIFFPKSSGSVGWTVYNAQSPSFWAANFKDYFLYLSSRTANQFPDLQEVEFLVKRLEEVELPPPRDFDRHYLRPRAVYFDNKHEDFVAFADYLYPQDDEARLKLPHDLDAVLRDGYSLHTDGEAGWFTTYWDIRYIKCSQFSDHFHVDHKEYYEPFLENFRLGSFRDCSLSDLCRRLYS